MADNDIKVLMMGARRAGKTSVLSGLYNLMVGDTLSQMLTVKDVTPNRHATLQLEQKAIAMRELLEQNLNKVILMDEASTNAYLDYTLEVSIPGNEGSLKLTFTDANGEFYATGAKESEDVKKKIPLYDIIVVAIDTPFLMEAFNNNNKQCTQAIGEAYNQVAQVHNLLAFVDDADGQDAKLVFFVPIKCERWAHEGRIDEVTERVEQMYRTPLRALCAFKNIEVVILPVQTVGNLEFEGHRKALTLNRQSDSQSFRCSPYNNDCQLILANGELYQQQPDDMVLPDIKAKLEGFNIVRPNSWFRVTATNYAPHNCEQLAYYILQFSLAKALLAKKKIKKKKKWSLLRTTVTIGFFLAGGIPAVLAINKFLDRLGTVNTDQLQHTLRIIEEKGLWKTSQEGIKVLNKGLLSELLYEI